MPRLRHSGWLTVGLVSLGSATALACLDVAVPPSLPFEWETPLRRPTGWATLPAEPEAPEPVDDGATRTRGPDLGASRVRPAAEVEKTTAMGYARITTVDIMAHLNWREGPQPGLVELPLADRKVTGGGRGPETRAAYPPPIEQDLYWLSLALVLRSFIHPNLISEFESLERLVEMGAPALAVLHDISKQSFASGKPVVQRWLGELTKQVGPLPRAKPRALTSDDPEQAMLLRLIGDELADGWALSLNAEFAAHTLALPPAEVAPLLARYAGDDVHPLLRRNAVALLGSYRSLAVEEALLDALRDDRDAVISLRAALALARVGNPAAVDVLKKRLKSLPKLTSLHLLGLTRSPEAIKPALKLLKSSQADELLIAARALGRTGVPDAKVIKALTKLTKALAKGPDERWFEPAVMPSTIQPDRPSAKRDLVVEVCLISLARLGDDWGQAQLFKRLDRLPEEDPNGGFNRSPVAARETFGQVSVPAIGYLVETLEHLGGEGQARLRAIVEDAVCEASVRLAALRNLERVAGRDHALLEALLKDRNVLVRATALGALAGRPAADAHARRVLEAGAANNGQELIKAAEITAQSALPGRGELTTQAALRESAGEAGKLIQQLPPKSSVTITGKEGDYFAVTFGAKQGFVLSAALKLTDWPADRLASCLAKLDTNKPTPPRPQPGAGMAGNPTLEVRPPLAEHLCVALGEAGGEAAEKALVRYLTLRTHPDSARGAAAVALGRLGTPGALTALVETLGDPAPWVRYCAFRGLRHTAQGEVPFVDWIYGDDAARAAGAASWRTWLSGR
jgi:HEAT repeat protein